MKHNLKRTMDMRNFKYTTYLILMEVYLYSNDIDFIIILLKEW